MGNVPKPANGVAQPRTGEFGGFVRQQFRYDRLNRLTAAEGTWALMERIHSVGAPSSCNP